MSEVIDISQGWQLGWVPETELNTWRQRFGDWRVRDGALFGSSPAMAQILANTEPESDHIWESRVCVETAETSLSVIVCFMEQRGTYYQVVFSPGSRVKANYVLSDTRDGELMAPCGPVVEAGAVYRVRVHVLSTGVHIFVDDEEIGSFNDARLAGRMAGFMVNRGRARIESVEMRDAASGTVLFADGFSGNSLRRTTAVELSDLRPSEWVPAVVPGTVHTALLEAGRIDDPYYGHNGPKQKWIDKQRWVYRKTFTVPENSSSRNVELVFEGIDYHGYIWLNGELLGYHEGMHLARSFDVTDKVRREADNELVVCLLPCPTPPHSNVKPYIFQRWHFNMDIVTIGLWRPVKLRLSDTIRLKDPQVVTKSIDENGAVLDVGFTVVSNTMCPFDLTGTVRIEPPGGEGKALETRFSTGHFTGAQRRQVEFRLSSPRLWWPNGMGEQPLYTLRIDAQVTEHLKGPEPSGRDSLQVEFGVRTLEMRPAPDGEWKYNWVFAVNGEPFFAKGSNWMPIDQMLRLDPKHYDMLLQRAKDSHINMLRPWGAGLIETDAFYDACDRLGICVWQEVLLANGYFHQMDRDVWRDTIVQNVKRLRNRASLVMWCGGNEFDPDCEQNKAVVDMLENLCGELDPSRGFHRASPYGGDSHSYQVNWMGGANYTHFTRELSAAVTEFSMASPPCLDTLRKVIPEEELASWPPKGPDPLEEFDIPGWDPSFRERESGFSMHDAHLPRALGIMMPFISDSGIPKDWAEFVEYAQTGQGMLTRFGIDFWRSRWPRCTATMSWVFNVTWPSSMTWEYVDWFGAPKASYYDQKRAYEPLHVGAVFDELFTAPGSPFRARLFIANDTRGNHPDAEVHVRLYDIALERLAEHRSSAGVRARETRGAGFFQWLVPGAAPDQVLFLCVDLHEKPGGTVLSRSVYTPRVGVPAMRMPYLKEGPWVRDVRDAATDLSVEWSGEWRARGDGLATGFKVTNTGGRPAYRVRLHCPGKDHELRYSDNHFWLEGGETRAIHVRTAGDPPETFHIAAWNAPSVTAHTA